MGNYTVGQFLSDVKKEAAAVKQHATGEEIDNLNFSKLDPWHYKYCIYGQMTGDCTDCRAMDLVKLCTPKYFLNEGIEEYQQGTFSKVAERAMELRPDVHSPGDFSAIEAYIMIPGAKNSQLIAYLKGETETLEL